MSRQDGHSSRKARQAMSQSCVHRGFYGYVAGANAAAGTDAPGRSGRDIDSVWHIVVRANGSELSARIGYGRTDADRLKRATVATAWQSNSYECKDRMMNATRKHPEGQKAEVSSENPSSTAKYLERETGFEPATSTLARSHSTTELLPLSLTILHDLTFHRPVSTCTPGSSLSARS